MKKAIVMDESDNVATALERLSKGETVQIISAQQRPQGQLVVASDLPMGHKLATAPIPDGAEVRKYGAVIGKATKDIARGDYVHIHNVRSERLPLTAHMLGAR